MPDITDSLAVNQLAREGEVKQEQDKNPGLCEECGREVDERCRDDYCRDCHVTCSWESCQDGTWANEFRVASGLPALEPRK